MFWSFLQPCQREAQRLPNLLSLFNYVTVLASGCNPSRLALHSCPASGHLSSRGHGKCVLTFSACWECEWAASTRVRTWLGSSCRVKIWVPSTQACGPQGTSAKPLRRRKVEALGVHTLPGMPTPRECQWDLCGGVLPVLPGFLLLPGCARARSSCGVLSPSPGTSPALVSQSL